MRGSIFWGSLLVVVGGLFLLGNMGIITFSWGLVWPIALILFGLTMLLGLSGRGRAVDDRQAYVRLEQGVEQASVRFEHGVGVLNVSSGTEPGVVMSGVFSGGVETRSRLDGPTQKITLKRGDDGFPFFGPWGMDYRWDVRLTDQVPISIRVGGSAGKQELNLTALRGSDLRIDGGAGRTDITLPARAGQTKARVDGGAGKVVVRVPDGVAVRMKKSDGLGAIHIDQRFQQVSGNVYESPGYAQAANRVDLRVDLGVGSIVVEWVSSGEPVMQM